MTKPAVITYDGLPSGAHRLRGKDILSSFESAKKFIGKFSKIAESSYKLELYLGCKETKRYIPWLRWRFGLFPQKISISAYEKFYRWNLSEAKALEAAKWISEISPLPDHWISPIRLVFDAQYYLLDPDSKDVLPTQRTDLDFDDS